MPYHLCAKTGDGSFSVIVETAREAIAKAAQLVEEGHGEVVLKDLEGNVLSYPSVAVLAGGEGGASW